MENGAEDFWANRHQADVMPHPGGAPDGAMS